MIAIMFLAQCGNEDRTAESLTKTETSLVAKLNQLHVDRDIVDQIESNMSRPGGTDVAPGFDKDLLTMVHDAMKLPDTLVPTKENPSPRVSARRKGLEDVATVVEMVSRPSSAEDVRRFKSEQDQKASDIQTLNSSVCASSPWLDRCQ